MCKLHLGFHFEQYLYRFEATKPTGLRVIYMLPVQMKSNMMLAYVSQTNLLCFQRVSLMDICTITEHASQNGWFISYLKTIPYRIH